MKILERKNLVRKKLLKHYSKIYGESLEDKKINPKELEKIFIKKILEK